jgi:hypothetical protein
MISVGENCSHPRPIENELYRAIPQSHVGPKAAAGTGTKSREEIGHVVWLDCGRDRSRVRPGQGGLLYSAERSDAKGGLALVSSPKVLKPAGR